MRTGPKKRYGGKKERSQVNSKPEQDRFTSKRVADPGRRVFWRSSCLVPEAPGRDDKKSDLDFASIMAVILIQDHQWLGKVAHLFRTSKYDSLFRLIDLVVQCTFNGKTTPLGFEICLAQTEGQIAEQILALRQEIGTGQEFAVKYFDSPSTGIQKNTRMPKVLWGWTFAEARELIKALVAARNSGQNEAVDALKHHPLRTKFITQTLAQLLEHGRVARAANNMECAEMYMEAHNAIERLAQQNQASANVLEDPDA